MASGLAATMNAVFLAAAAERAEGEDRDLAKETVHGLPQDHLAVIERRGGNDRTESTTTSSFLNNRARRRAEPLLLTSLQRVPGVAAALGQWWNFVPKTCLHSISWVTYRGLHELLCQADGKGGWNPAWATIEVDWHADSHGEPTLSRALFNDLLMSVASVCLYWQDTKVRADSVITFLISKLEQVKLLNVEREALPSGAAPLSSFSVGSGVEVGGGGTSSRPSSSEEGSDCEGFERLMSERELVGDEVRPGDFGSGGTSSGCDVEGTNDREFCSAELGGDNGAGGEAMGAEGKGTLGLPSLSSSGKPKRKGRAPRRWLLTRKLVGATPLSLIQPLVLGERGAHVRVQCMSDLCQGGVVPVGRPSPRKPHSHSARHASGRSAQLPAENEELKQTENERSHEFVHAKGRPGEEGGSVTDADSGSPFSHSLANNKTAPDTRSAALATGEQEQLLRCGGDDVDVDGRQGRKEINGDETGRAEFRSGLVERQIAQLKALRETAERAVEAITAHLNAAPGEWRVPQQGRRPSYPAVTEKNKAGVSLLRSTCMGLSGGEAPQGGGGAVDGVERGGLSAPGDPLENLGRRSSSLPLLVPPSGRQPLKRDPVARKRLSFAPPINDRTIDGECVPASGHAFQARADRKGLSRSSDSLSLPKLVAPRKGPTSAPIQRHHNKKGHPFSAGTVGAGAGGRPQLRFAANQPGRQLVSTSLDSGLTLKDDSRALPCMLQSQHHGARGDTGLGGECVATRPPERSARHRKGSCTGEGSEGAAVGSYRKFEPYDRAKVLQLIEQQHSGQINTGARRPLMDSAMRV